MKASYEEMKQEAVRRMNKLKLSKRVIDNFKEGKINCSVEDMGLIMVYWLPDYQMNIVRKFEKRFGVVAYYCILTRTSIGLMLSILYVSEHKEEWEMDCDDIENNGTVLAWVENLTDPELSELGGIQVKTQFGALVRTA